MHSMQMRMQMLCAISDAVLILILTKTCTRVGCGGLYMYIKSEITVRYPPVDAQLRINNAYKNGVVLHSTHADIKCTACQVHFKLFILELLLIPITITRYHGPSTSD